MFSVIFYERTIATDANADAFYYYEISQTFEQWGSSFGVMRNFMFFLAIPLTQFFEASFFVTSITFGWVGFLGILLIALPAWRITNFSFATTILIFLPTFHYWTSSLSKESIAVFAVGLVVFGVHRNKYSSIILGVILATILRPYLGLLLALPIGITYLVGSKSIRLSIRILLAAGATIGTVYITLFLSEMLSLHRFETVEDFVYSKQSNWTEAGTTHNLAQLNWVTRGIFFMYRPFVTEAGSLVTFAASIDNLMLMLFTALAIWSAVRSKLYSYWFEIPAAAQFSILYTFLSLFVLSTVTANLGTAVRKKTMLLGPFGLAASYSIAINRRRTKPTLNRLHDRSQA